MHRRLTEGDFERRFVCLTFDDGYRDTLKYAYPILKEAGAPFAVYVATSFPDRLGELWWLALEAVIARNNRIGLVIDGQNRTFDCTTLRREARAVRGILLVAAQPADRCRDCATSCATSPPATASTSRRSARNTAWAGRNLAELAADPLVTIGAHTVNHPMLAKLPEKTVRSEMDLSRSVIEAALSVGRSICPIRTAIRSSAGAARICASPPSSASRPR